MSVIEFLEVFGILISVFMAGYTIGKNSAKK